MKYTFKIILILSLIFKLSSCKNQNKSSSFEEYSSSYKSGDYSSSYEDGDYCAKVEYYNPKTHNSNTWTLPIKIEDNKLVKIKFTNGGWMDEDHFDPPEIIDGSCEFENDKGYQYEVSEISKDCDY